MNSKMLSHPLSHLTCTQTSISWIESLLAPSFIGGPEQQVTPAGGTWGCNPRTVLLVYLSFCQLCDLKYYTKLSNPWVGRQWSLPGLCHSTQTAHSCVRNEGAVDGSMWFREEGIGMGLGHSLTPSHPGSAAHCHPLTYNKGDRPCKFLRLLSILNVCVSCYINEKEGNG